MRTTIHTEINDKRDQPRDRNWAILPLLALFIFFHSSFPAIVCLCIEFWIRRTVSGLSLFRNGIET